MPNNYIEKVDKLLVQELSSAEASAIKAVWSLKFTLALPIFFSQTEEIHYISIHRYILHLYTLYIQYNVFAL